MAGSNATKLSMFAPASLIRSTKYATTTARTPPMGPPMAATTRLSRTTPTPVHSEANASPIPPVVYQASVNVLSRPQIRTNDPTTTAPKSMTMSPILTAATVVRKMRAGLGTGSAMPVS